MNRGKKILGVAIAAAMGITLAACGPSTSGGDDQSGEATDLSTVEPAKEIAFWGNHPGNSIDFEQEMAKKFEDETGIKVNIVSAGSNYYEVAQKYQTAQVGGEAGDLVITADVVWFGSYLNGSIAAVDDIFASAGLDTSTYYQALYDDYLYEGKHYALPYARSALLFYYNKDLYREAGLDEDGPDTWDEVRENSIKLAETDSSVIPLGWASDSYYISWAFSSLLWSYGTEWSNEWDFSTMTSPEAISALEFAQQGVKDGWAQVVSNDPSTLFGAGSVAQIVNSSGSMAGIVDTADFDIGVKKLPIGPSGNTDVIPSGGAGIAINANTTPEKQLAAAMFIDFITNPENTADFSALTGYVPVRQDADTAPLIEAQPLFSAAIDSLGEVRPQSYARVLIPGGSTALDSALMKIMVDQQDVTTVLTDLQAEIQGLYDNNVANG